jgi:uncharacterized protein
MKTDFLSIICLILLSTTCTIKDTDLTKVEKVGFSQGLVNVEIADNDEERGLGLMFRTTLATNAGMLFVFDNPSRPGFYMKNTAVPLDIIFINKDMKVVTIRQMEPFDENTHHQPAADVLFALEVNKGWSGKHNVKVGDEVTFITPKGK